MRHQADILLCLRHCLCAASENVCVHPMWKVIGYFEGVGGLKGSTKQFFWLTNKNKWKLFDWFHKHVAERICFCPE